jgi:hypothetical protein
MNRPTASGLLRRNSATIDAAMYILNGKEKHRTSNNGQMN